MPTNYVGTAFVVQVETATPGTYQTVACQRSTSGSINNEQIDVTAKCNMPWRHGIEGGIRSMTLSLSGVFNDHASMDLMLGHANTGAIVNFKLISEAGDSYTGPFLITSLERSGEYNDAEQYSMTLESQGIVVYA